MGSEIRVLIVDDNVDAADLTAEYLRVFGTNVTVAYGGAEALVIAKTCLPTLIFLDIGMPGTDGYAVAKALRSDPAFVDVKIIALTAWGDAVSREKSKEAGFDLHITKPAKLSLLLSLST
jgi:CheY-like chemotaxis protein